MKAISRTWNHLPVLAGALLMLAAGVAAAGTNQAAVDAMRERKAQRQEQRQEQRAATQERRQQPREQREQRQQPRRADETPRREPRMAAQPQPQRPDPRTGAQAQRRNSPQGNAPQARPNEGAKLRPGLVPRDDRPRYNGDRGRNDARNANRPSRQWRTQPDGSRQYRPVPPRRHVPALPHGYTRHSWNGRPYYYFAGSWYRPWGSSFAIVRPPLGLYVSYLPSYHTSFYYGGSRYFFADDTYYIYEPARSSYVVTRSPYGDENYEEEAATFDDDELYVYPAQGQSEEQQADDRYECHRWAVGETAYDPVEGNYDPDRRAEYLRALSACLSGRGYTVR